MSGLVTQLDIPRIEPDWRNLLSATKNGYKGDERNVVLAMRNAPELKDLVCYNEFSLTVNLTRAPPWRAAVPGTPWIETDDTALQAWLQTQGIAVRGRTTVPDTVLLVAQDMTYHPVREYLNGLQWDGVRRLSDWLKDYLDADGPPDYLAAIGRRFPISAVARIFKPGCQADHVLVLEGPQGIGKTSCARVLAVRQEWYAGSLPDIHTKDAALQLAGRWIIELSELKAIRNSQIEATKSFITETADVFRPPYARRAAQFPRQCVFIATTNESEYLRDRTGNRRYWPVRCGRIRLEQLADDRDQLWAEAVHEYRAGTTWHLTADEYRLARVEQSERVHVTELEADVDAYLAKKLAKGQTEVSVQSVLTDALNLALGDQHYAESARRLGPSVAEALERLGWHKVGRRGHGDGRRSIYRWTVPENQGGQGI